MGSVVAHTAIPGLTGAMAVAPVVSYYEDESGRPRADRLVNGAPEVELVGPSSHDRTKWVAYLMEEEFPDGTRERISHGYADSRTWKSMDTWTPMEPGKPYRTRTSATTCVRLAWADPAKTRRAPFPAPTG